MVFCCGSERDQSLHIMIFMINLVLAQRCVHGLDQEGNNCSHFHVQIGPLNAFAFSPVCYISTFNTSAPNFPTSFILNFPSHTLNSFLREGHEVLQEKGPRINPRLLQSRTSTWNTIIEKDTMAAVMAENSFLMDSLTFRSNSSDG